MHALGYKQRAFSIRGRRVFAVYSGGVAKRVFQLKQANHVQGLCHRIRYPFHCGERVKSMWAFDRINPSAY